MTELLITPLADLAVLEIRGPDTERFLQGQLSHDMALLPARSSLLAGLHNPQGRVVALLRLFYRSPDEVFMVLPASLAGIVRQLLMRYVLRAKVRIEDASAWQVLGNSAHQLVVAPRHEALPPGEPASRASWRLADIREGIPEVGAEISGAFVAQMLNLDLLDAISYSKGCYTGQEIIARAHYRGQIKRRMQRFGTSGDTLLAAGQRVRLADGRSMQVVMSAPDESGNQEFLAVGPLAGAAVAQPEGDDEAPTIEVVALPLPYELPG